MKAPTLLPLDKDKHFGRLVIIFVSVGFIAIFAAGLAAAFAVQRNSEHTTWLIHTYDVERAIGRVDSAVQSMRFARRGYLLDRRPAIREDYDKARGDLQQAIDRVAELTRDNAMQQRLIPQVRALAGEMDRMLLFTMAEADAGRMTGIGRRAGDAGSADVSSRIQKATAAMLAEEQRLLGQRVRAQQSSITLFYWALGLGGILLFFVAIASVATIRHYTSGLMRSRNQLRVLNEDLEGAVRVRTIDLQRANDEIQRFAYIVSHDLRSPLVNVMGFTAELDAATHSLRALIDRAEAEAPAIVTEDARLAAREDLPEAIGFIRTSTQKMDRLINAILRLSREGRRTIAPETLDMVGMFQGVADTLRHRTEEAGATISIAGDLPPMVSDRLAVEQIASNLVENAVKYLRRDRPGIIEVTGQRRGLRVLYQIKDNGRGIDPKDHERVFDLFRRSGEQDQPGEGIGLAHVRALAYRLGGTITVASQLGEGAVFEVNLPAVFAGAGEKER
ncbi:MAG: sensor histidine kinase [Sphingobium phenoxybenzoativorans]